MEREPGCWNYHGDLETGYWYWDKDLNQDPCPTILMNTSRFKPSKAITPITKTIEPGGRASLSFTSSYDSVKPSKGIEPSKGYEPSKGIKPFEGISFNIDDVKSPTYVEVDNKKELNLVKNESVNIIHFGKKLYVKDEGESLKEAEEYSLHKNLAKVIDSDSFEGAKEIEVDDIIGESNESSSNNLNTEKANGVDFDKLVKRVEKLEASKSSNNKGSGGLDKLTGLERRISDLEAYRCDERLTKLETEDVVELDARIGRTESRISSTYAWYDDYDLLALINAQAVRIAALEQELGL